MRISQSTWRSKQTHFTARRHQHCATGSRAKVSSSALTASPFLIRLTTTLSNAYPVSQHEKSISDSCTWSFMSSSSSTQSVARFSNLLSSPMSTNRRQRRISSSILAADVSRSGSRASFKARTRITTMRRRSPVSKGTTPPSTWAKHTTARKTPNTSPEKRLGKVW
jgi:hypothetical protein